MQFLACFKDNKSYICSAFAEAYSIYTIFSKGGPANWWAGNGSEP